MGLVERDSAWCASGSPGKVQPWGFFLLLVLPLTEPDVAWHLRSPIFKAFHWERSYRAQNQSDQVKVLNFHFFIQKNAAKHRNKTQLYDNVCLFIGILGIQGVHTPTHWLTKHTETNLVLMHIKKLVLRPEVKEENRNLGKCTRNKKSKQKVKAISIFT